MKFRVDNSEKPSVVIKSAGATGEDAKAEAIVDAYGQVVGLKVLDPVVIFSALPWADLSLPTFSSQRSFSPMVKRCRPRFYGAKTPKTPGLLS